MKKLLLLLLTGWMLSAVAEPVLRYAAPEKLGSGNGTSAADAAAIADPKFWEAVNVELKKSPVTVKLAAGKYVISVKGKKSNAIRINGVGDEKNLLTIAGAPNRGSVFCRSLEDDQTEDKANYHCLFDIRNCRNVLVEGLFFNGHGICGYVTRILDSQDITLRDCHWLDMRGAYFGASGAHGEKTRNVLWENCSFENVGLNSHAHMLYNANSAVGLTVRNSTFTDCTGDYVRFRNNVDEITVENCTFVDTGKIKTAYPFLSIPLFVDFDEPKHYEYFSKKMTIRNNRFTYQKPGPRSVALLYHHSGFNPPGKQYLFSKDEVAKINKMSVAEGRKFLGERLGVNIDDLVFEGNQLTGCKPVVLYESRPRWGAEKNFPADRYDTDIILDRFFNFK